MVAVNRSIFPARLAWLPLAIASLAFSWLWFDYRSFWFDDAFITFRYSLHLSEGFGPVYNPGERVEGYTSFLWMLVAAIPLAGFSEAFALALVKGSGWLIGLWILFRVWSFPAPVLGHGPGGQTARWLVVLLATSPPFLINCGDGMETPLFMALLLECAHAMLKEPGRGSGAWVGGLCAGLIWTRPESLPLLVALPVVMMASWRGDEERRADLRSWLWSFALVAGLPVVGHQIWRWSFYGHPFPNTYYAKATGDLSHRLKTGWQDIHFFIYRPAFMVHHWIQPVTVWLATGLAGLSCWRHARSQNPLARVWLATLVLFVLFRVSFDLWSGSEAMGHHRFIVPVLIPLFLLADEGLRLAWRGRLRVPLLVLCVIALGFNVRGHEENLRMISGYQRGLHQAHIPLGIWLRENYPRETWAAIGDAGTAPFFSRIRMIDLWGLNDPVIAHLPGEYGARRETADYAMNRRPDLVILWNKVPFRREVKHGVAGGKSFDRAIARHPEFQAGYRFIREFVFRERTEKVPGYYLDVFERRPE
jgi:arabinofuranosyltransferase